MSVCGTKDILLCERLLWKCDLTLSKAICACHAAEETCKHAHKIVRSQPSANTDKIFKKKHSKSNHNTRNQNTRDFIKKCKFCDSSHPRGKCPAYGKVCHVCNKKIISKFAAHALVKSTWNWKGWIWWTLWPERLWFFCWNC